jgi:hypothetical protein
MENYSPNRALTRIITAAALTSAVLHPAINRLYQTKTIQENTCSEIQRVMAVNNNKFLVFTSQGIYNNIPSRANGIKDSATIQQQLETGQYYDLTTYGWNTPSLFLRPNIIKVTPNANCQIAPTNTEFDIQEETPQTLTNSR